MPCGGVCVFQGQLLIPSVKMTEIDQGMESHKACSQCHTFYYGRDRLEQFDGEDHDICNQCTSSSAAQHKSLKESALANNQRHGSSKKKKNIQFADEKEGVQKGNEGEVEMSDFKLKTHKIIEEEYMRKEEVEEGEICSDMDDEKPSKKRKAQARSNLKEKRQDDDDDYDVVLPKRSKKEVVKQPKKRIRNKKKPPSPQPLMTVANQVSPSKDVTASSHMGTSTIDHGLTTPLSSTLCVVSDGSSHNMLVQKGQDLIHCFFDLKKIVPEKCDLVMTVKL